MAVALLPAIPQAEPHPSEPAVVEGAPLEVEWGHCFEVTRREGAIVCIYDPEDPVRIWIQHPRANEARVWVDGAAVEVDPYVLPEEPFGFGYRIPLSPGAEELVVEVPEGENNPRTWGLLLIDRESLRRLQADEEVSAPPVQKAYAKAFSAMDSARLVELNDSMVEWYLAHDQRMRAAYTHVATAFALQEQRNFEAAEEVLDSARKFGEGVPEVTQALDCHKGLVRWSQGRLHESAVALRDVVRHSLRIEYRVGLADSTHIYAEALAELGYHQEARRWGKRALEYMRTPCGRALVLRNNGWTNLLLRAHGRPHDDPSKLLDAAIEIYRAPESECASRESGARLSLALLALEDGRIDDAGPHIQAVDETTLSQEDRVRVADLRVRLSRAVGDPPEAQREALRELEAAAEALGDDDGQWRVATRRGELLASLGEVEPAIEALEEAERVLDRLVRIQALVGVGRTATADRYLDGTVALVSVLVEAGRLDEALCVARRARARRRSAVAGLDGLPSADRERLQSSAVRYREHKRRAEELLESLASLPLDREASVRHEAAQTMAEANQIVDEIVEESMTAATSPTCEDLVPPEPGELLIDLFPREGDWLVLTDDGRAVEVAAVETPAEDEGAEALARRLLEPIDARLEAASRIRVLAHREAQEVELHQLPWRGRPLLASRPVAYGVELPRRERPASEGTPRALLLADPSHTLVNAEAEVEAVRERLQRAGWATDRPELGAGTEGLGERGFTGYSLLHYAAHTEVDDALAQRVWPPYPGGVAAGQPFLQLGPASRLDAPAIIARRPVPPIAFLAGCETGVVELDAGSTSVALAFLLADGQQVVASREALADDVAVELAERFYDALVEEPTLDAARAMHRVQQAWSEQGRGVVPYRVWVR